MRIRDIAAALMLLGAAGSACAEEVSVVRVEGLERVSEKLVLNAASVVPGSEPDAKDLQADIEKVFALGYFSHVGARADYTEDGRLEVVFEVEENPLIKDITFDGLTLYDAASLKSTLATRPGSTFNSAVFRKDMESLSRRFGADGLGVTLRGMHVAEDGTLSVLCHEPRIGEVRIDGNKHVKDHVILKYAGLKGGERYSMQRLRYARARLRDTGLFIDVVPEPSALENGDVDVILHVAEQKSAVATINGGWGTDSGFSGGMSFRENNLGGNGQRLEAGFDLNEDDESSYRITWSDPYMDRHTLSWEAGLYAREDNDLTYRYGRSDVFDYREEMRGGYAAVGRWLDDRGRWQWKAAVDRHSSEVEWQPQSTGGLSVASTKAWFDRIAGDGGMDSEVFSFALSLTHNGLDPVLPYPSGWKQSAGIEQAVELFGGDCGYTKYWAEAVGYIPLEGLRRCHIGREDYPVTLAARVRAGWSAGTVPIAERYSLGGDGTLRGFESGDFRGHEMFMANAELRVPVAKDISIAGFYDTGNAWDTDVSHMDLSDLYDSWGAGVRLATPMGLVRVDVAWGGDETKWHFGFGEMF